MNVGTILRICVIAAGAYMLLKAVLSLARRKMTDSFCLAWAILSALMILSGILLNPSQMDRYVSVRGLVLIMVIVAGSIWGLWFISTQVSVLERRNQELAIQLSLLNRECEKLMQEVEELKKNEKDTVCD